MAPPFCRLLSLHNVFFREIVPDPHAHILPGAGGILGDTGAVVLADQPALRVQPRVRPCDVRAVPSILRAVLAVGAALFALILAVLVFILAAAAGVFLAALGHESSPPG